MIRLWNALLYSLEGLYAAWEDEAAFRLEVMLSLILGPAAFYITEVSLERALLVASLLLVLMAELFNSAIEAAMDRIGEEEHLLTKTAKDCGSAAVFVSALIAGSLWFAVLWEASKTW